MVKFSKWIQDTKPDRPISVVARKALRARLKAVWHYAPLAAKRWEDDIEYTHQLRVATRRARAALHIFADLLPPRDARWMKQRLRELRSAAGDARDLDSLEERLQKIADEAERNQLDPVLKLIRSRRRKAQKPLIAAYQKSKRKGFKKRLRSLVKAVRWRLQEQEPTFIEAARTKLVSIVDNFFAASAAELSDIEALHQMRIAGKQVRYAMELLVGAFDHSFRREIYSTFAEVQQTLGEINDHATASKMLRSWKKRAKHSTSKRELSRLIATEEEQLETKRLRFLSWWTAECSAELKSHFARVLSPTNDSTMHESTQHQPMTGALNDAEMSPIGDLS